MTPTQKLTELENTNLAARNEYLILFPSASAYMQFHNQKRQLIPSARSKNVMQLTAA